MATKKGTVIPEEEMLLEQPVPEEGTEEQALPQTDSESAPDEPHHDAEGPAEGSEPPISQTDPEPVPDEVLESPAEGTEPPIPQTDSEDENSSGMPADGGQDPIQEAALHQTDPGTEEKPPEEAKPARRTRKAKAKPPESDTVQKKEPKDASDGVVDQPSPRRKRAATRPTQAVVAIGDHLAVETEAEKSKNDLLDLMESFKGKRILTGTIQGVERPTDAPSRSLAVIYHGDFKVIIPAEEAVEPPEDFRGRLPEDVMHYMLTKRLGAEVDYIVKGIDAKSGIAAASRLEAMAAKRREYYFGTDRDGNNLLYEGICAEARIVSVIRAGIFVDLFGLEVYIPLRELSYQRMLDAQTGFQPGQRILTKILNVDRSDRNHIKVSASIKQAGENPYEKALRRYTVGNRYVGTVSVVDTNGVFVSLDGGIDCLCSYPKRGRPPRGARVTVRILGINNDSNRIWGAITHIAVPR